MARQSDGAVPARGAGGTRPRTLTRRGVVAAALGAAGASAVGISLTRPVEGFAEPVIRAIAQETDAWLPELRELVSENGLLNLTLVATGDESRGEGALGYALSVDPADPDSIARSPGPTLRLRRGDRLRIHLDNNLLDETNLHVHGLHVSPSRNGDNVFVHVHSVHGDGRFDYEYQIPEDHRSGLFWYHPHFHGTTGRQVQQGLAGAIIIEERDDDPAAYRDEPPDVKHVPERLLVLQHLFPFSNSSLYHVNGKLDPAIRFRPGERERWRILNASSDSFLNLYLDGLAMHRVAVDGNWLETAVASTVLPLGPAERAEVIIDWGYQDAYALSALAPGNQPRFVKTDDMVQVRLATLVPEGSARLFGATPAPVTPPADLLPLVDLRQALDVPERELEFQFRGGFRIDGKTFSSGRVDQTVELDGLEQWTIRNTTPPGTGWHPLHIHVNDFQVLSISANDLQPVWYTDTVPLPPMGNVVIRAVFPDFTGRFVYHCHFLEHEDAGMMGVVEVVQPVRLSGGAIVPQSVALTAGPTVGPAVNSGATVVWTNLDERAYTIVADDTEHLAGQPMFASGPLAKGESFAHTFDAPGAFTYQCTSEDHPSLAGVVNVAAQQTVEILDFAFQPVAVTVAVGTTVAWTNRDADAHTATADAVDDTGEPMFDTGPLEQGGTGSYTFATAGNYAYHCDIHPAMTGMVVVRPVTRQSVSLVIGDDGPERPEIEVFTDSTVTWTNQGSMACRVNVAGETDSGLLDVERLFEPGKILSPGQRFSHTFSEAGDIPYTSSTVEPVSTHAGIVKVVQPVMLVDSDAFAFEPPDIAIPVGASVVWLNHDSSEHTITVESAEPDGGEPIFDSGPFGPGALRRHAFATAGAFSYRATAHPGLVGTITVTPHPTE